MKVLVTGYKGFIGQNMGAYLDREGIEWVGYDFGEDDYSLDSIDLVMHLGAISSTTFTDVKQILLQNYYFTKSLLNRCNERGIRVQLASSASLYGPNATSFKESDFLAPSTPYAWSKFLMEEYSNTHTFNMNVQIFRYFNVHGPKEEHKGDQSSPHHKFKVQGKRDGIIKVFEGSENFKRDFIHVDQIIDYHMRFLNVPVSGTWNLGTGVATSFREVAESIAPLYFSNIKTIPFPDSLKASYQHFTLADMSLTTSTLKDYDA